MSRTPTWRQKYTSKIWFIPVVVTVLIILHLTGIAKPFERLATVILHPIQTRLYSWSQERQPQPANAELEQRIQALVVENAQLKTQFEDVTLLKEQLDFLNEKPYHAIQARVTSKSTENLSQTIVINRGAAEGVQIGYPAIIKNGVLIGTIQSVQDHSAEVLLITSFDSRISAAIQNEKQSPGIVQGAYNLSLEMNFIPQLDAVSKDQTVLTTGADPFIPAGLVIGQVETVVNEPGSLFQKASLKSFFTPADISILSILTP